MNSFIDKLQAACFLQDLLYFNPNNYIHTKSPSAD